MVHLIVTYDVLKVSTVTGQDHTRQTDTVNIGLFLKQRLHGFHWNVAFDPILAHLNGMA